MPLQVAEGASSTCQWGQRGSWLLVWGWIRRPLRHEHRFPGHAGLCIVMEVLSWRSYLWDISVMFGRDRQTVKKCKCRSQSDHSNSKWQYPLATYYCNSTDNGLWVLGRQYKDLMPTAPIHQLALLFRSLGTGYRQSIISTPLLLIARRLPRHS